MYSFFRIIQGRIRLLTIPLMILLVGCGGSSGASHTTPTSVGKIIEVSSITEFTLPNPMSDPSGITAGPDGNLWFTDQGLDSQFKDSGKIGRISPSGTITEFALPNPKSRPSRITAGPDGNLWFTEEVGTTSGKIGRISPSGTITEFVLPNPSALSRFI